MKILILGGTAFLGPQIVEYAKVRGHQLTLFNRGRTNPQLFPDLEKLQGDRDPRKGEGLKALEGRSWDAVIDTSGYYPRMVTASAELLAGKVRQYVFISSISAYAQQDKAGLSEEDAPATVADPAVETMGAQFENYGGFKAMCEQAAEKAMPGRVANIRPGLIVGPGDNSDRFTYWPVRIDRGGEVLAPEPRDASVQFIDVRDLAEWIVRMVEDGHAGLYNAIGPLGTMSMAQMLHGCRAVTSSEVKFTWVAEDFLLEQQVGPWMEMPLWIPRGDEAGGRWVKFDKALAKGLTFRPLAVTAKDTLDWHKSKRPADYQWGARGAGMKPEKEAAVLKAWHERH